MTEREKQIRILRNYIEKAIYKTMKIEHRPFDHSIEKINTELTKLIAIIDGIKY